MLVRIYPEWKEKQLQFVGIAMDSPEAVTTFLQAHPVPYPTLIGQDNTLTLTKPLGNAQQGLPMTVLMNSAGHIVWVKLGRLKENELTSMLAKTLVR